MVDEYTKRAYWIVCPWCDEEKCIGRFVCPHIKQWVDEQKEKEGESSD